jgi:hypothetical protein
LLAVLGRAADRGPFRPLALEKSGDAGARVRAPSHGKSRGRSNCVREGLSRFFNVWEWNPECTVLHIRCPPPPHTHTHTHMHTHTHTNTHAHRHRHRHTHTHTDTGTHSQKQTHRHIHIHTNTQTHRHGHRHSQTHTHMAHTATAHVAQGKLCGCVNLCVHTARTRTSECAFVLD